VISTILLCCVCLIQGEAGQDAANRDTVESVVDVLNQAQMANEARYNTGQLTAILRTGQTDAVVKENNLHGVIRARVRWSNGRVRTDLTRWGPFARPRDEEEGKALREVCIIDAKKYLFYGYTRRVIISPIAGKDIPFECNLTPRESWYTSQLDPSFPCVRAYTRNLIKHKNPKDVSISAQRLAQQKVRLVRTDSDDGSSVTTLFSYDLDGNVEGFELDSVPSKLKIKASMVWKRDSSNRVFLQKLDRAKTHPMGSHSIELYERLEVTSFDADFKPEDAAFEMGSLDLPSGTVVNDDYAGKTYRVGDRPNSAITLSIDTLVEVIRRRGFATQRTK